LSYPGKGCIDGEVGGKRLKKAAAWGGTAGFFPGLARFFWDLSDRVEPEGPGGGDDGEQIENGPGRRSVTDGRGHRGWDLFGRSMKGSDRSTAAKYFSCKTAVRPWQRGAQRAGRR